MRKKLLLTSLAGMVMLVAACGNANNDPAPAAAVGSTEGCDTNGVTISASFAPQGAEAATIAKATIEKKYSGLKVELNASATTSYDELTQQVVADIAAGSRPDVVMVGLGQVRFWVDKYSPAEINPDNLKPSYDRRFLNIGEVNGKPYVAPFQVSMPVLYTNTDMADKAGVPAAPTTSSELLDAARKVKQATGTAPVQLPRNGIADWVAQAYIQSGGASFVNDDGTAGFDSDAGRKALSIYEQLGKDKLIDPVSFTDATTMFSTGKLAYLVSSPANVASVQKAVGDKFDWTVTAMPLPDGGTASLPAGGNGWIVLSQDRCKAAFAGELISAMLDPQVIATSAKTYSYVPVDTEAAKTLAADPAAQTQLGFSWKFQGTLTPWGGWHGDSTPKVNKMIENMIQQLTDGATVEEVVPRTVRQINATVD